MTIHDVSEQHIFPNKLYTTYELELELVVTVAAARRTIVKKIKPLGGVFTHIYKYFTTVWPTRLHSLFL